MTPRIRLADIPWRVINLASRPDRWEYVTKECARVGIKPNLFPALRNIDYQGPAEDVQRMVGHPGRIGCYFSHLWMMRRCAERRIGIQGILEDDVMFCDDFQERFRYIEEHFDKPWDMFFLGSTYHLNPTWHKELGKDYERTDIPHIHRIYGTWNTYAYLVNCASAQRIVDLMLEHAHRSTAVDHLYILLQPMLQCYCFTPGMAFQIDDRSDVEEGITKFSGFLPLGPHIFQKRLEDWDYAGFDWPDHGKNN